MTWLSWLVFLAAIFAAGTNGFYLVRKPDGVKWYLRLFNALAVIYFGGLYLLIGLESVDPLVHGPVLIRPGILILLLLLAAEPIADYRR